MHTDSLLSLPALYGFLLVLARVAGVFTWVPLPGMHNSFGPARIVLSLAVTISLLPEWPAVDTSQVVLARMAGWMLSEAALGASIGLAVAFLLEAFMVGAQITALQAGYAYASTIDPDTQADSGVLLVIAQLTAGLLFFALGLDREIVRALAASIRVHPPGSFLVPGPLAEQVWRLGSDMFATGLRLAMPALGLLVLVDVSLALFGRMHAQLQLLSLAFPLKMLAALAVLISTIALFPAVFRGSATTMVRIVRLVLER